MAQGDGRLVGGAAEAAAPTVAARLVWVDNLKITVVAGVIVVQTATAYLLDAIDWYYDTERTTWELWAGTPGCTFAPWTATSMSSPRTLASPDRTRHRS